MKYKYYHYLAEDGGLIRVRAKRRPSKKIVPYDGTYIVREYSLKDSNWLMPCFPQIIADRLFNKCQYLGCINAED